MYGCYVYEIGIEGTPHLQGYVFFGNRKKGTTVSNLFQGAPHLEVREGTHSEAKHYNMKPIEGCVCHHCRDAVKLEGPWEYGDDSNIPEGQGHRSDLETIKRKLDEGVAETVIADEHFSQWTRYHKAFREYKRIKSNPRRWEMEIITLVGDTGTGKTRWAYDNYPGLYSVPHKKDSGCYWDGYDNQPVVLVDEMYGHRFSYGFLLCLTDRYTHYVPFHGGNANFSSKTIIFTSNSHPRDWFDAIKFPWALGPLQRRFTQGNSRIVQFVENNDPFVDEGYNAVLIAPINQ